MPKARVAFALFIAFFAAYLFTMPAGLAPYRDAGEMAASAATLGVSHPPSYPLYIVLGKVSLALPFGTPAFRLTLLSALCGAAAAAALFYALAGPLGAWPALAAAVWLGTSRTFWGVSIVCEMYSLTALQAVLLLGLALSLRRSYDARRWRGFAFLYGLFLGNRTDLLLLAPGLLWLVYSAEGFRREERTAARWIGSAAVWGAAGLSIYLYLPLRSSAGPWLDWNHPATLYNLIGSLTRRSYGATLDLLSKSYGIGENLPANLRVYGRHLWTDYLGLGAVLPLAGLVAWWRRDRAEALGLALAWLAAGPIFIFLANMPPNPHAMAIVEPHYLLSDILLAVFGGAALLAAGEALAPSGERRAAAVVALLTLVPLWRSWDVDRRWDLLGYDYVRNVLLSVPRNATLVAKKDVQIFSLWYAQRVEGLRPDVKIAAQGLAGSPWYQESRRRLGERLHLGPLRTAEDWSRFAALNGELYATTDCDFPQGLTLGPSRGMVLSLSSSAAADEVPWTFIARRAQDLRRPGTFRYDDQPDFFDSDVIEAYAAARERLGVWLIERRRLVEAERPLRLAWAMKWLMPDIPVYLAYAAFQSGRLAEAQVAYLAGIRLFEELLRLTEEYASLPEVRMSARRGLAEAHVNLGVVCEKLGKRDEAEAHYREAARRDPESAQAHFNLGVLYWNRDWNVAAAEMAEALRLDPNRQDAARFLAAARSKLH
ncbi:MAG: DUF2723 domain-containing protein [Elusimicrobia bacterium]|nr:DUF2723 domain-containing protein [Elusimicrobiota bacterium]